MPKIIVSEILMLQKYYYLFLLTRLRKNRIINIIRITPWNVSSPHSLKLKVKIESQYIF